MSEPDSAQQAPAPVIRRRPLPSLVWLIPLITAIIGGWLIYSTLSSEGPRITITFKTADGIEAGKTHIKYKNLDIGTVESLRFSKDFSKVILTARMEKQAEPFLRRDTRFWVVRPHLGLRGASGLSTLISGSYIELEPGKGAFQRRFDGLETPPVVKAEEAGTEITLLASKLGSIDTGSPIYYQGIVAGEVLGYELANNQRSVLIHGFVKAPFDQLVRGNSRFWNVSGMDVSLNADGLNVRTESLQSLLYGGIAFETPTTMEPVEKDIDGLVFTLYDNHRMIEEHAYTQKVNFVMFFAGSVRGLSIGAPVEFKGIKVGSVVDVRLEYNAKDTSFRIPVLVEIEPERVIERDTTVSSPQALLKKLVDNGLRARLQTGNLLTGQLFVELDMRPDTPIHLVGGTGDIPELPTIPAELAEMTTALKGILAKLDKVDFEHIGKELERTLHGTNELMNSPNTRAAMDDLRGSLSALHGILQKVDRHAGSLTDNLDQAMSEGRRAMRDLHRVLGPDSQINEMSGELAETARSIRTLVDLLERNPQSLIFGKNPPGGKP